MNLGRALGYAFEDREWVSKLLIVAILTFVSLAFMPLLIGLLPLAAALGYMLAVAVNVRDDRRPPLPTWDNLTADFTSGAGLLVGLVVYNLPLIVVGCCLTFPSGFSDRLVGGLLYVVLLCCAMPFTVIYIALAWPMMAVGTARYLRTRQPRSFFQFGSLWDAVFSLGGASLQWLLCALLVNALFMILSATLVGLLPALALLLPVHGHLLGQYAALVDKRDRR